jgi:hypothetical protein
MGLDDSGYDILLNAEDDMDLCPYPRLLGFFATAIFLPLVSLLSPFVVPLSICGGCVLAFMWICCKIYGQGCEVIRRAWHRIWYMANGL